MAIIGLVALLIFAACSSLNPTQTSSDITTPVEGGLRVVARRAE
jgi:hypothetical protein